MTEDPRHLQALLDADSDDPIPPEHERLIRAALASQLAAGTSASEPSSPREGAPPAAVGDGAAAALKQGAAWKLVTVALIGLGSGAAGFVLGRASAPSSAEQRGPLPNVPTVPNDSVSVAPSAAIAPTASDASAASVVASAAASTSAAPSRPTAQPPGNAAGFDREQSLLERARSALLRHDVAAAQEAIDACAREFPRAKHGEERDYLQILIVRERGDAARARELAASFLAKYPSSLLRPRVEAIGASP